MAQHHDSGTAEHDQSFPSPDALRATVGTLRERPRAQVLIIGGGINGVATFRDLALQGIDVALVERGDYCQGASGASSHMIHGGIRYLENGEFRLVHESVVERNRLLRIAPHYVKPLQTTIPIFSTFSGLLNAPLRFLAHRKGKPHARGALLIKLGLSLYDAFSREGGTVPRHRFVGRARALADLPQLRPDVKYTATYFDASVHNPERLTLDVLRDGIDAGGAEAGGQKARAANYVSAVGTDDGGVRLRDELTGEEFAFSADVVVNCTGAWTDETNAALGSGTHFMGGTKGSHVVLDAPELLEACAGREIFFEHTDGRIVLIYPIGDRVLVGTTDIDARDDLAPVCTDAEIEYFFELMRHVFPGVQVGREQIVYTFSGVRPLPRHSDTAPGFVSRDYWIERTGGTGGKPVRLSLVGGKWTTFRALAEQLANRVLGELGSQRRENTEELPIGGGAGFPTDPMGREDWLKAQIGPGVDAARAEVLLERYGTRAAEVIAFLRDGEDSLLKSTHELSDRELAYLAQREQIGHAVDVLIRRTSLAFRGLVTRELVWEVASTLAPHLGWDGRRVAAEADHALRTLAASHRVHADQLVG
ncbi:glycerol-3-phosphate dehydrogenase/oxidase [Sinomonas sp. ASV322]|uniref:glycerol-3-phosphate dehydrogenase/oxidase n=1 Tax=Sinomonas sp. ASV322 TaxID=3041920 RepID=UPI0027DB37CB|nr:glycerol-3-phosphate dehydrogenase/oxidase [Sinomonas sp. ASV322]MDQ4501119.1 glycerol-3-phosphate dehydrogenase/oxidase [Sinomonas sp. ASV322]